MKSLPLLLVLALLLAACAIDTADTVDAPWPTADLTYFRGATVQITGLQTSVGDGMLASSQGDAAKLQSALADVQAAGEFFGGEQAPARFAPLSLAGSYAATTCARLLESLSRTDGEVSANDCRAAIQAARMEIGRAVAAAGSWPPTVGE